VPGTDGRDLTATLLYSPDGEHWQVLGAAAGTEVVLDDAVIPTLPGSEDGRLRIIVTDGIETFIAEGEPTVRVPNGAPQPWIDAPAKPLSFPLGGRVTLSGAAQDREDRVVPDSALAWSSSIDGPLGTGPEVMTRGLSAGRHTIVLEATDSAGLTGQASIELVVDGSVVDAGVPVALETAVAGILDRLGGGLDPSPVAAVGPAATEGIPLPVLLVVVLALLAIGGTSVWIRVAQPHTTSGGEIALKGASIGENVPPSEPATPRPSGRVEGLKMETDVIEAPPDDLPPKRE
jgi:hypothetical protein